MLQKFLPKNHHNFKKYENITEAINKSSGIEILRVQKERIDEIDSFNFDNYINNFQLNKKNIENADDELQILHPMPMNVGVELDNYAAKNFRMQHIKQLSFGISARTSALKYSLELI